MPTVEERLTVLELHMRLQAEATAGMQHDLGTVRAQIYMDVSLQLSRMEAATNAKFVQLEAKFDRKFDDLNAKFDEGFSALRADNAALLKIMHDHFMK